VVVEAAAVERIVTDVVCELIDEDPAIGRAALFGLQFSQVADRAVPLVETRRISRRTGQELILQIAASKAAMSKWNELIHSFWIVEGDDGDPALQVRSERARVVRTERVRTVTPAGSKVTYKDKPVQLTHRVELAIEVTADDISDVAAKLSEASDALLQIWYRIAKELRRSHPDPDDPTLESYPNRQFVDVATIKLSSRAND
jgi:hypothetical protein